MHGRLGGLEAVVETAGTSWSLTTDEEEEVFNKGDPEVTLGL